jgi:hypothetical protein
MPHRTMKSLLVGLGLLIALPSRAHAIAFSAPCDAPYVFSNAAVNVVVLPYSQPAAFKETLTKSGEQLAALVQLESMLAIAKYGSIGLVQLVGDPREGCTPDDVLPKLLGQKDGAMEALRPGGGLVLVWGRIYESGPDLFVQSFIRFVRRGINETIDIPVANRTLRGQLTSQAFACTPRRIAVRDLEDVQKQYTSARLLHAQPDLSSAAVKLPEGAGPFSFFITDVRGDWVQLEPIARSPGRNDRFQRGWLQARAPAADWSLRRQLPELGFVEAAVGYLAARVPRDASAQQRNGALTSATNALGEYLGRWRENAVLDADPSAPTGTAFALAVPRQLGAFIRLLKDGVNDASLEAAQADFQRAATQAPHSAEARALTALTGFALSYRRARAEQSPRPFLGDLQIALGADPSNKVLIANVVAAYDLMLTPPSGMPANWSVTGAERQELTRQRDALRPLAGS